MDVLAHAAWAGIAIAVARRRWAINGRAAIATVALAVLPDVAQLLPLLGMAIGGAGGVALLSAYATALPGQEPLLPPAVALWSHHLHCALHSALVAGAVSALVWALTKSLWIPLLGWWSHIVIDVFTHSAQFYPVPVLYPLSMHGFDGVAWNAPWFVAANYAAIAAALLVLATQRISRRRP